MLTVFWTILILWSLFLIVDWCWLRRSLPEKRRKVVWLIVWVVMVVTVLWGLILMLWSRILLGWTPVSVG